MNNYDDAASSQIQKTGDISMFQAQNDVTMRSQMRNGQDFAYDPLSSKMSPRSAESGKFRDLTGRLEERRESSLVVEFRNGE